MQKKLRELWDRLESQIFLVLDEEGYNVGYAKVRMVNEEQWLYVDDVDGFVLLSNEQVKGFSLIFSD